MIDAAAVIVFLEGTEAQFAAPLLPDTALIESGLLDSQALFQLSLWIEDQLGAPLTLETLEIARDWNTPTEVARFIERARRQSA
jgi:acyl carrier protein